MSFTQQSLIRHFQEWPTMNCSWNPIQGLIVRCYLFWTNSLIGHHFAKTKQINSTSSQKLQKELCLCSYCELSTLLCSVSAPACYFPPWYRFFRQRGFFMTVSSIVFGTKNKPEEKPKSPQRSFIAADGFEFTTELVSYIPANAVSSSAVHFHTFPPRQPMSSQTDYILKASHIWANPIKLEMFRHFAVCAAFPQHFFVFPILPHWKLAFLVGVAEGRHPFVVTEGIFKNGPVMENCLLGLESKQLYFWMEWGTGVLSELKDGA